MASLDSPCGTSGLFPFGIFVFLNFPCLPFTAQNLIPDLGISFKEEYVDPEKEGNLLRRASGGYLGSN